MVWLRWFLLGLVLGLGALGFIWRGTFGTDAVAVDFVARVDDAALRRPSPAVFAVRDVAIGGETRRSITMAQASRIAWDQVIPERAWLDVSFGVQEEAWTTPGPGVLFRAGLSSDGHYEEFLTQVVDPHTNAGDRQWRSVRVDLSAYTGRTVSLIFNAASAKNTPAAWGALRLMKQ